MQAAPHEIVVLVAVMDGRVISASVAGVQVRQRFCRLVGRLHSAGVARVRDLPGSLRDQCW